MPREKENIMLKSVDYAINGNIIRAFYDEYGKLVFILDSTIDKIKPNVLLVITSYGNRKWDDILANDYAMDLELVRPKKDNKYQKLDIEYDGLSVYDELINAYKNDDDLDNVLQKLNDFRNKTARHSAESRLNASNIIAEKSRETIERTEDTIVELQAKIKAVRAKLIELRRGVGREPTKQSAAKILKAEAQLDILNDKLERAKKRLENAKKRLLMAEDDMSDAQSVLDILSGNDANKQIAETDVIESDIQSDAVKTANEDIQERDDKDDDIVNSDMEIKPLFDKDPKILDEKIAFKPIHFDEPVINPVKTDELEWRDFAIDEEKVENDEKTEETEHVIDTQPVNTEVKQIHEEVHPMSFEPYKPEMDVVDVPKNYDDSDDVKFDDVFSESGDEEIDYTVDSEQESEDSIQNVKEQPIVEETQEIANPVLDSLKGIELPVEEVDNGESKENVEFVETVTDDKVENNVVPAVNVIPENIVRPTAPLSTNHQNIVTDIPKQTNGQHRPSLLYYVLLLVLIGLSVFTLWMYHRSNVSENAIPELVTTETVSQQQSESQEEKESDDLEGDPFVASGDTIVKSETNNVEKVVGDSLEKISQVADIKPVEIENQVEPVSDSEDSGTNAFVEENDGNTSVNKPEYNVGQDQVVVTGDSGIVGGNLCEGDIAPDANGCCPGETYSTIDEQKVCCPDSGGDCFPPMF